MSTQPSPRDPAEASMWTGHKLEDLLDILRAAKAFGISPKTLRDHVLHRRIDYVKIGGRVAPEPLNSFIQFSCEIGICEGEIIDLLKADVHMTEKADDWGHYGYLQIRKGKTELRKRSLPITAGAKEILTEWMPKSKSDLVFTREDGISPVSAFTLIQQQERMRNVLNLPWGACVHSARHTALTNLGLTGVDPFTLQRAAGHANITTTRKYVHPTPPTMKDAFQKKVRNERRDRRSARKRAARIATSPSIGAGQATDTVQ